MVQNQGEYLHHLPVAPGLPKEVPLQALENLWQFDERPAVPQGTRFALAYRHIVALIVNRPTRLVMRSRDYPCMFADGMCLSNDDDTFRINPHADSMTGKGRRHAMAMRSK